MERAVLEEKMNEISNVVDLMAMVGIFSVFRSNATDGTGIFKDIDGELSVNEVFDKFESKIHQGDSQVTGMFWDEPDKILNVKELVKHSIYRDALVTYWGVSGEDKWKEAKNKVCSVQLHLHQADFPNQEFKNAIFSRIIMSN